MGNNLQKEGDGDRAPMKVARWDVQASALGLQWPGGSRGIRWNRVLFRVLGSCVEWQAWKVNLRGCILWVCRIEKSEHFMWGEGNGRWVCDSRGNEWLSLWSRGSNDLVDFHNLLWPALLAIFLREGNENGCTVWPANAPALLRSLAPAEITLVLVGWWILVDWINPWNLNLVLCLCIRGLHLRLLVGLDATT